jgi:OOP family OmpA-OmpF porin
MKNHGGSILPKAVRIGVAAGIVLAFCAPALAQEEDRAFSVQNFLFAPGSDNYLTLEGASVPQGLQFRLGGFFGYQYSPLRLRECVRVDGDRCAQWAESQTNLVAHHTSFELAAAFSLYQIFEVGLALPVVLYQAGDELEGRDGFAGVEPPRRSTGLGDLRLQLKLDLLHGLFRYKGDRFGLSFINVFMFPTGNAAIPNSFMGHESMTMQPKLAFDFTAGRFRVGFNAGYLWRTEQQFYLAEIGQRFTYGAATEITFTEKWSGLVEMFGSTDFAPDITSSPLEGALAGKFKPIPTLSILFGGGAGIFGGVGTPIVRAFAGVAWSPAIGGDSDEDSSSDDQYPEDSDEVDNSEIPEEDLAKLEEKQIKIAQKIHFEYDSNELTRGSQRTLRAVAKVMKKNPEVKVRIEGHTDSVGPRRYNRRLSQRRVDSVKTYLVENGVPKENIEARGYGETRPTETNDTRRGRAANRRVEFHVIE